MKSKFILILLIVFGIGKIGTLAQDKILSDPDKNISGDTMSIQNIVSEKIADAKAKQNNTKVNDSTISKSEKFSDNTVFIDKSVKTSNQKFYNSIYFKAFILVDLFLAALLFVGWKRRKDKIDQELKSRFKKNIKNLRDEKIKVRPDERMINVRKSLQKHPICNSINENEVTQKAKELSISKGEIYLASKLKEIESDE